MQGVQCTRAQRCGGPKICPTLFLKSFLGEEGALLEYLHAGPLQPCYATGIHPNPLMNAPSQIPPNVSVSWLPAFMYSTDCWDERREAVDQNHATKQRWLQLWCATTGDSTLRSQICLQHTQSLNACIQGCAINQDDTNKVKKESDNSQNSVVTDFRHGEIFNR